MSVISKKNLKNFFFIIWYILYLQQGYFLYWNQGWLNNAVAGVLMAIYPLSIFHLESLRTTGEVLSFKGEFYDQLSKPEKFFLLIAELASIAVFGLFTFMGVFSLLFSPFKWTIDYLHLFLPHWLWLFSLKHFSFSWPLT